MYTSYPFLEAIEAIIKAATMAMTIPAITPAPIPVATCSTTLYPGAGQAWQPVALTQPPQEVGQIVVWLRIP